MKKAKEIKEVKPESVIEVISKITVEDFIIREFGALDYIFYEQGFQDGKDYIIDQLKKKGF
jgi:hypothetical protein